MLAARTAAARPAAVATRAAARWDLCCWPRWCWASCCAGLGASLALEGGTMRKVALGLALALIAVGCGQATEKDIDEGITLWGEVSDSYLDVLEANQTNPKKALEEGQKFIDTDEKFQRLAKIGNKRGTQAQQDRFAKA